jgi:outer membrane receptor protein involved in Fe transport
MSKSKNYCALLSTVSLGAALAASAAHAQAQPQAAEATGLEQVVVTATRQSDTVNRVPLSIAAVTQQTLDQQGIKQVSDLTRLVPGLNAAGGSVTSGVATFSIRGIVGGTGAATTGVYLDDTSLTKRANNGVNQNNGAPLPILFDLERVEVLKGPQGTLYGGSSQGGTIRFITPEPSLNRYSGLLRLEGRTIKGGEPGYEIGAAAGGPIVEDKLGLRASIMRRKTPGYIDAYSPYTNKLAFKDANSSLDQMARVAVKWQVTDRLSAIVSAYGSKTTTEGGPGSPTEVFSKKADGSLAAPGETFTTPQVCIDTRQVATFVPYQPNLPVGTAPAATAKTPVGCTASTPAANQYIRPAVTYGPFDYLGKDDALQTGQQTLTGSETRLDVYDLTFNYDFEHMTVKAITSYVHDASYAESNGGEDPTQQQSIVGGPAFGTTVTTGNPPGAVRGFPLFGFKPDYPGHFTSSSKRRGLQQEIRFSSAGDQRPLTWVAGIYYSNNTIHQLYYYADRGLEETEQLLFGLSVAQRYGISNICACDTFLEAKINDNEIAAFSEANYWITDKLHVTGGLRFSRVSFKFDQVNHGVFASRYPNSANSYVVGQTTDSPTTPKVGLTYDFTPNNLVYVTAAKGFRAGGSNSPVTQSVCQTGLDQFGITSNDVPAAFAPDSVWSYEAGGKFRLLDNKMQLNGAVYRIDWTGIQSTFSIPGCGQTFVQNGGKARSQGADVQAQFRPIQPMTLSLNVGYTDAKYIDPVAGPRGLVPGVAPSINAGDHFAIPKWQVSASVNYNFRVMGIESYARADYQWQGSYTGPGSFGVAVYNPFTFKRVAQDTMNARVGMRFERLELNLYSNNILGERDETGSASRGVSGCAAGNQACSVFTTFNPFVAAGYERPRENGIQANYRF